MTYPKQSETVHIETLNDELCLYDWQRKEVHALNPTAAKVWQMCDGQTSPADMAAKLRAELPTDLNASQTEALVRMSLKELDKSHLLAEKSASDVLSGSYSMSRRQFLKLAGGVALGALVFPTVQSILAPSPVAAQSVVVPPVLPLVIFDAGGTFDGNLGGRAGADAICQASANRPAGYTNVRAFISVSAGDSIANMPANYGIPANAPIVGQNGTQLAANWADLLDSTIAATLDAAGSGNPTDYFWTGSNDDGTERFGNHCQGWTVNGVFATGELGLDNATTNWLDSTFSGVCNNSYHLIGIAW
jgi:hypothetical protein